MLRIPLELTLPTPTPIRGQVTNPTIILVGCGGTGARVAALLPRILSRGTVILIDPDIVEPHNLSRQHFHPSDIGRAKVDVVAARILGSIPERRREEFTIIPVPMSVADPHVWGTVQNNLNSPRIFLGCVDNYEARKAIQHHINSFFDSFQTIWIDAGNDLRYGQVVMSLYHMPMRLNPAFVNASKIGRRSQMTVANVSYPGLLWHAPTLFDPPLETVAQDCGIRIDTQTVAANNTAATIMGNLLAALVDGLPISSPFYEFSTVPTMITSTPFKRASMWSLVCHSDLWSGIPGSRWANLQEAKQQQEAERMARQAAIVATPYQEQLIRRLSQ